MTRRGLPPLMRVAGGFVLLLAGLVFFGMMLPSLAPPVASFGQNLTEESFGGGVADTFSRSLGVLVGPLVLFLVLGGIIWGASRWGN